MVGQYSINQGLLASGINFGQLATVIPLKKGFLLPSIRYINYGEFKGTDEVGNPKAVRAVANAVGMNSLSIIVPCHRVIGSDGKLHGYAGGVSMKERLLEIESKLY